jgi:hypothetical protein
LICTYKSTRRRNAEHQHGPLDVHAKVSNHIVITSVRLKYKICL